MTHEKPTRSKRPFWQEFLILGLGALLAVWLVTTFVARSFSIPSGSMEDTLQVGDRVLVERLTPRFGTIERGDIVVFDGTDSFSPETSAAGATSLVAKVVAPLTRLLGLGPAKETDFIKRVVAVGGDRVVCCDADGRLTVNGVALEETYLHPGDVPSEIDFDVVVPLGRLWVMGDHRSASADSRAHLGDPGGGTVSEDRVIGRAFLVSWPFSRLGTLGDPTGFDAVPDADPAQLDAVTG